MYRQIR